MFILHRAASARSQFEKSSHVARTFQSVMTKLLGKISNSPCAGMGCIMELISVRYCRDQSCCLIFSIIRADRAASRAVVRFATAIQKKREIK